MNNKLNLVAAGVAMAVASGGANATALNAANEIFIGGATAPQSFMREDILLRVCDSNIQVFVDSIENTGGVADVVAGKLLKQGDHFVIRCTTKNDTSLPADLRNVDLAVYKYNGGSATGVAPVSDPANASPGDESYLDASVANCGGAAVATSVDVLPDPNPAKTYDLYECPAAPVSLQYPDGGISDVEPKMFKGALALDFGTEPRGVTSKPTNAFVDQGNLHVKAGPGLVFGFAVTLPMYNELVDDQVAAGMLPASCASGAGSTQAERDAVDCMPSLPKPMVRSILAGQVTSWADVAPYGQTLNPTVPEGNNVHICERTRGSGTHAQVSVEYLGTNCRATSNLAMIPQNDGLAFAGAGVVGVYANSGSSDMDDCLTALGDGTGFDGDFHDSNGVPTLPPESYVDEGDSTVVPGTDLPHLAIPGDPLGRFYDQQVLAYGVGYQSLEKNVSLSRPYRFVKIDEVPPTLEKAAAGEYEEVYYLSYQNRVTDLSSMTPDLQGGAGQLRSAAEAGDAGRISVAKAFFDIWDATDATAIDLVNDTFVVNPDGVAGGDDWQGGFLTPSTTASYSLVANTPETRWARQTPGTPPQPDSCQDLGLYRQ
jgi:hypothetical protein